MCTTTELRFVRKTSTVRTTNGFHILDGKEFLAAALAWQ